MKRVARVTVIPSWRDPIPVEVPLNILKRFPHPHTTRLPIAAVRHLDMLKATVQGQDLRTKKSRHAYFTVQ